MYSLCIYSQGLLIGKRFITWLCQQSENNLCCRNGCCGSQIMWIMRNSSTYLKAIMVGGRGEVPNTCSKENSEVSFCIIYYKTWEFRNICKVCTYLYNLYGNIIYNESTLSLLEGSIL